MPDTQNDPRAELWENLKQNLGVPGLSSPDQVIQVATRLLAEWSRSRDDMHEILAFAVEHDGLDSRALILWNTADKGAASKANHAAPVLPMTKTATIKSAGWGEHRAASCTEVPASSDTQQNGATRDSGQACAPEGLPEENRVLWASFKREAVAIQLEDSDAVLNVAMKLVVAWGINRSDMRQTLAMGVQCGELCEQILEQWDARWRDAGVQALAVQPLSEPPQPEHPPTGTLPLPSELLAFEATIVEYSRRQSNMALLMGRQLLAAKSRCKECRCSFKDFLAHLERRHGLSRSTCYIYMKYATWNLPEGLGTAVMKWIVQGFKRESALVKEVIQVAVDKQWTLDELVRRYGAQRRQKLPQENVPLALSEHATSLRTQLLKEREQLLRQLQRIQFRLRQLDAELMNSDLPDATH